ncbi:MAG: cell division protein FtsZ [Marinilabiliaceae bacterium]|nr:cell division protein FtsZ [Marinilabiliaceae bacterium]
MEDLINFEIPVSNDSIIKVIGVGGGGSNAVNYMYNQGIKDVSFVVCNTDAQALENSPIPVKVQLGESLTEGRGAGSKPEIGRQSAIENLNDVTRVLENNTKMVFITAGMGGGTGTGAAPIIAKAAKDMGILTVGIVTIPFRFEGKVRINQALDGIAEMEKNVDSLLVINNEKLREMYGDLKLSNAFAKADNVLTTAAKGIAEIITIHGYINVDFADVETVMKGSGVAIMGSATAEGDERAIDAIQAALESPLLNNNDIRGAKNILLNITSGVEEITMDEVGEITDYVQDVVGANASIIWGTGIDPEIGDKVNVTIIATGFDSETLLNEQRPILQPLKKVQRFSIDEDGDVVIPAPSAVKTDLIQKDNSIQFISDDETSRVIDFDEIDKKKKDRYDKYYKPIVPKQNDNSDESSDDSQGTIGFNDDKSYGGASYYKPQIRKESIEDERIIEKLENIPAYKRKNMSANERSTPNERDRISRFSLLDDPKDGTKLTGDNPFLFDNVD